jgi:hypothetical protein
MSFPYDLRTGEEKWRDQHFEDFLETGNPDCDCGDCQYLREQERRDLENVD